MKQLKIDWSWVTILLCAAFYAVNIINTTGIYDQSDGLAHLAIARYAPKHPELFLDHWGKPLFTMLTSAFAQIGIKGVMVFNLLLFVLASRFLVLLMRNIGIVVAWFAPVLLALSPVWFEVTMGGLTEPLFATLLLAGLYYFNSEKYIVAALILAWLPFARSEAVFVLPLFAMAFLFLRQFKAMFLLGYAVVIMSVVGFFVLGDILWIINNNPYVGAKDIYGSGPLWHFWDSMFMITGVQVKYLTVFGLIVFAVVGYKEKKWLTLLLAALSLLLTFAGHSWFWYKGLMGSYGLIRVMATVLPLMLLFAFYGASKVFGRTSPALLLGLFVAVGLHLKHVLFYYEPIPKQADNVEFCLQDLADWYKHSPEAHNPNVWYMHPLIGYYLGIDHYDTYNSRQLWYMDPLMPSNAIRENGLIIYDGNHAPNEGNMSKEALRADPQLVELTRFVPKEEMTVLNNYPFELLVFQKRIPQQKDTLVNETFTANRPLLSGRLQRINTDSTGRPYFDMVGGTAYMIVYSFWMSDTARYSAPAYEFWYTASEDLEVFMTRTFAGGEAEFLPMQPDSFALPEYEPGVVRVDLVVNNPKKVEPVHVYNWGLRKLSAGKK